MKIWAVQNSGLLVWIIGLLFFAVSDVEIIKKDWQSVSQVPQQYRKRPYIGPAVFGFWIGLTIHFFTEAVS